MVARIHEGVLGRLQAEVGDRPFGEVRILRPDDFIFRIEVRVREVAEEAKTDVVERMRKKRTSKTERSFFFMVPSYLMPEWLMVFMTFDCSR
jgi:hypothetical protein